MIIHNSRVHFLVMAFMLMCVIGGWTVGKIAWHLVDQHARDRRAMMERDLDLISGAATKLSSDRK